jgi:pimeloyl-ACP methyl ester carboxylesterase
MSNSWKTLPSYSGLINLSSTTQLHATITGPPRIPGQPLIIIIPGLSASPVQWTAVTRLASTFARILLYSRSGYGLSTARPDSGPISAVSIATEMSALLQAADLKGPYVLVAHSWGGIIGREFVHLRNEDVAGLVMVDANQEINTTDDPWPLSYVRAMGEGLDFLSVTGIRANHRLSAEEWTAFQAEAEENKVKHAAVSAAEMAGYRDSGPELGRKKQLEAKLPVLGERPVSVLAGRAVQDFEKIYQAGLERGNGTEKERSLFREMEEGYEERDNDWQKATMRLSRRSRWRVAGESGHNVQFTQPEVIVEELKWVLKNCA